MRDITSVKEYMRKLLQTQPCKNRQRQGRFNGKLKHSVRGRDKERKHKKTLLQNNTLCSVHRMCSDDTFIQVQYGLSEVLTRTSMLINEPLQ